MRGVHVRDPELLADSLAGPARIPVVRVDDVVPETPCPNRSRHGKHEVLDEVVHVLLANELVSAEGNAPDAQAGAHVVDFWLILELPGHDVDPVPDVGELLGQLEDEDNLPPRVRSAELGLGGDVAMGGQHENGACVSAVGLQGHLPSWSATKHRRAEALWNTLPTR